MRKLIIFIWLLGFGLSLNGQHRRFSADDSFTRQYFKRYYNTPFEVRLFNRSWNRLMTTYIETATYSNRLSSVSSFDFSTNDPEVLLSEYYRKIDQLNQSYVQQQEANNAMIDRGIRGLGELAANIARENNITTKNIFADFLIKEIAIGTVQERTKQKNAEKLELQRRDLQSALESNLSNEMSSIRDQMLSENDQLKDKYFKAMAYEADYSKERYYASCYDYYGCFSDQIRTEYSYRSTSWYKPNCITPKEDFSMTEINGDYIDVAIRKLDLYRKYKNDIFIDAVNIFIDAGLSQNRQNPKAFFLKAQMEKEIINKLFFTQLAFSLDQGNNTYETELRSITDSFNEAFFTAIRNNDIEFISKSIEKGFQLGREKDGQTAIEAAIDNDRADILEMLINSTVEEKNSLAKNGNSLLFHACAVNALEVVKKLIELGLNPEFRDKNYSGLTALNIADRNNSEEVFFYLASNFEIKPALVFTRKNERDDLDRFSSRIYESVPSKMEEICSVYPSFRKTYLSNKYSASDLRNNGEKVKLLHIDAEEAKPDSSTEVNNNNNIVDDKNKAGISNEEKNANAEENISLSSSSVLSNTSKISEDTSSEKFNESDSGNFTDSRDGQEYSWVKVDNQIWMAENLAFVPSIDEGAWFYKSANKDSGTSGRPDKIYGMLYTYKAAVISCPDGWRIPSDLEWSKLESYLDNSINDPNKIGYRGNSIGYTLTMAKPGSLQARFGGKRMSSGQFIGFDNIGTYWTSTRFDDSNVWSRQIQKDLPLIMRTKTNEKDGFSVRCLKDDKTLISKSVRSKSVPVSTALEHTKKVRLYITDQYNLPLANITVFLFSDSQIENKITNNYGEAVFEALPGKIHKIAVADLSGSIKFGVAARRDYTEMLSNLHIKLPGYPKTPAESAIMFDELISALLDNANLKETLAKLKESQSGKAILQNPADIGISGVISVIPTVKVDGAGLILDGILINNFKSRLNCNSNKYGINYYPAPVKIY
jgi:uncharacterized protein (TIGR02145 family)